MQWSWISKNLTLYIGLSRYNAKSRSLQPGIYMLQVSNGSTARAVKFIKR